jgi:hypothetical protein
VKSEENFDVQNDLWLRPQEVIYLIATLWGDVAHYIPPQDEPEAFAILMSRFWDEGASRENLVKGVKDYGFSFNVEDAITHFNNIVDRELGV